MDSLDISDPRIIGTMTWRNAVKNADINSESIDRIGGNLSQLNADDIDFWTDVIPSLAKPLVGFPKNTRHDFMKNVVETQLNKGFVKKSTDKYGLYDPVEELYCACLVRSGIINEDEIDDRVLDFISYRFKMHPESISFSPTGENLSEVIVQKKEDRSYWASMEPRSIGASKQTEVLSRPASTADIVEESAKGLSPKPTSLVDFRLDRNSSLLYSGMKSVILENNQRIQNFINYLDIEEYKDDLLNGSLGFEVPKDESKHRGIGFEKLTEGEVTKKELRNVPGVTPSDLTADTYKIKFVPDRDKKDEGDLLIIPFELDGRRDENAKIFSLRFDSNTDSRVRELMNDKLPKLVLLSGGYSASQKLKRTKTEQDQEKEQREQEQVQKLVNAACQDAFDLGTSQHKDGQYLGSIEVFETLASSIFLGDADRAMVRLRLADSCAAHGGLLRDAGKHEEAVAFLERAVDVYKARHQKDWLPIAQALALSQIEAKQYVAVAATIQMTIEADLMKGPALAANQAQQGHWLQWAGKRDESIAPLQEAVTSPGFKAEFRDKWEQAVDKLSSALYEGGSYAKIAGTSIEEPDTIDGLLTAVAHAKHGRFLRMVGSRKGSIVPLETAATSTMFKREFRERWAVNADLLSRSQYEEGLFDHAAETSQALIESGIPEGMELTEAYANHGLALYKAEKYREAIPSLKMVVDSQEYKEEREGMWASSASVLVYSQHIMEENAAADATSQKLIESRILTASELANFYAGLGFVHEETGKYKEAIASLQIAADSPEYKKDRKDKWVDAVNALGSLQSEEDLYDDAVATYQKLLEPGVLKDLALTDAYANHGIALNNAGRHKEAIPSLIKAADSPKYKAELQEMWIDAVNALGFSQAKQGLYEDAAATFQKLLDPDISKGLDLTDAYANHGFMLYKAGNYKEAIPSLEKVVTSKYTAGRQDVWERAENELGLSKFAERARNEWFKGETLSEEQSKVWDPFCSMLQGEQVAYYNDPLQTQWDLSSIPKDLQEMRYENALDALYFLSENIEYRKDPKNMQDLKGLRESVRNERYPRKIVDLPTQLESRKAADTLEILKKGNRLESVRGRDVRLDPGSRPHDSQSKRTHSRDER